jgi:hypothetical protein
MSRIFMVRRGGLDLHRTLERLFERSGPVDPGTRHGGGGRLL